MIHKILVYFILIQISQMGASRFQNGLPLQGGQKEVTPPGLI